MIFSTFLNSAKKNQNDLGSFLKTFLAHFLKSKKTQEVLGGFSSIFSAFFNFKSDPGCFRRFSVKF